jgi:hypothetical protein
MKPPYFSLKIRLLLTDLFRIRIRIQIRNIYFGPDRILIRPKVSDPSGSGSATLTDMCKCAGLVGSAVPVEEGQAAAPDAGPAVPPHCDGQAVLAPTTTTRALPRVHILKGYFTS